MKVATWNVNSVRARLPNILHWLTDNPVDVLLLQEIKCVDQEFPQEDFNGLGYKVAVNGQKSYNGVAILSSSEPHNVIYNLPGYDEDLQRRYLQAEINGVVFGNIYLPNGNPINTEKFSYKIDWMDLLYDQIKQLKKNYEVIITGDFNVIPRDEDAHDIKKYRKDALAQPETRKEFYKYLNLDLLDVFESEPKKNSYTFFDYKTYKFGKEEGIRIDFFLISPFLKNKIMKVKVLKEYRDMERPSDHCPILMDLNI